MTMMAMGRDGAPTMTVRCPTGDNASGDHIVFNLQQRSFSSFSFHQKQLSLSCFLIMSSLLHQATTATTGASLLHQATTGASLLHQASTGASLMQRIQVQNLLKQKLTERKFV
ncbi:BnaCnng51920D, partial [Brassica napus]